ncbi:MAG: phosphodiester glycosidase family protein [Chloroflexota bacterium]
MKRNCRQGLLIVSLVLIASISSCYPDRKWVTPAILEATVTDEQSGALATDSVKVSPSVAATPTAFNPDTSWQTVLPGLEWRQMTFIADNNLVELATVVRIDPSRYQINVEYDPEHPATVHQWAERNSAVLTVNGGFFAPDFTSTGLVISDGTPYGSSYLGFGGMFAISASGMPTLQRLESQPYDPADDLTEAVQSFPMLFSIKGAPVTEGFSDDISRRSVVGLDNQGRVLFINFSHGALDLAALSLYLVQSDLQLVSALNLDGGSSSGLVLAHENVRIDLPSLVAIPAVITVSLRQ